MKISASFLGIKDNLINNINTLIKSEIDFLHVDVMDGLFVENKTNDYLPLLEQIDKCDLDIHLMVEDVLSYIKKYEHLKPSFITFHSEVNCDIIALISYLKDKNIKVGLSVKPSTKLKILKPYLGIIDMILIMSVEPGLGGQPFISKTLKRIKKLKKLQKKHNFLIQVDGGINETNISKLKDIDIAVIGSYITNNDYNKQVKKIKEKIYG